MFSRRSATLSFASVATVLSTLALGGCQSSSTSTSGQMHSSFRPAMRTVSETNFAQRHQFYYYPTAQIYRDCDQDRWVWTNDGGMTWQSGPKLPAGLDPGSEIPFAIFLNSRNPAAEHPAIAAAYPRESGAAPAIATAQGAGDVP